MEKAALISTILTKAASPVPHNSSGAFHCIPSATFSLTSNPWIFYPIKMICVNISNVLQVPPTEAFILPLMSL
jgi:hypothetical protein